MEKINLAQDRDKWNVLDSPPDVAATQEFPSMLYNPKIHYNSHNTPPVPILSQINLVHTIPSCLSYLSYPSIFILVFLVIVLSQLSLENMPYTGFSHF
jgi:hypothetical protein